MAYEASLNSLRVDLRSEHQTDLTATKINSRENRMFHLLRRQDVTREPDELVSEMASRDSLLQCIATPITWGPPVEEGPNLAVLLTGAERALYLGKAQVRGTDAMVFEALNSTMPFWLEQPVELKVGGAQQGRRETRPPGGLSTGPEGGQLVTLIYLNEDDAGDQLVMMEILRLDRSLKVVLEKWTVSFYDFLWNLASSAEERTSEPFSLQDHCSASPDSREQIQRIRLLVEAKGQLTRARSRLPAELNNPMERDLAVLAGLQESLNLATSSISELETKLVHDQIASANLRMVIGFRLGAPTNYLVNLSYLGKSLGQHQILPAQTLDNCHLFAAHRSGSWQFGFDQKRGLCIVSIETNQQSPGAAFEMDGSGPLEVYRTEHLLNEELGDEQSKWLRGGQDRLGVRLLDRKLHLELRQSFEQIHFDVVHVAVRRDEQQVTRRLTDEGLKSRELLDKIVGFGFDPDDSENIKLPREASSLHLDQMNPLVNWQLQRGLSADDHRMLITSGQCQAACLVDPKCEAYSVCIAGSRTDCAASKVGLRSADSFRRPEQAGPNFASSLRPRALSSD